MGKILFIIYNYSELLIRELFVNRELAIEIFNRVNRAPSRERRIIRFSTTGTKRGGTTSGLSTTGSNAKPGKSNCYRCCVDKRDVCPILLASANQM